MSHIQFIQAPGKSLNALLRNPIYQALRRKPMAKSLQTTQAIDARMAFDAISAGTGTPDDFDTVAGLANTIMVLAEKHLGAQELQWAKEAQEAVLRAQVRYLDGKAWNFDGEGRRAMLDAMAIFEQMVVGDRVKGGEAMKQRIYIAGPMTGLPDLNFPAFHAKAEYLRSMGHDVVNPAEINPDKSMLWVACMRRDIAELVTCDAIQLLPGWKTSKGASLEYHIADRLGMMIYMPSLESVTDWSAA